MSRIFIRSLGCPKNRVDSEVMAGLLEEAGHRLVAEPEEADVLLVNTCSFITDAKEESIDEILALAELRAASPGRRLVVTGCLVQQHGAELPPELPEVDLFLGAGEVEKIADELGRLDAGSRRDDERLVADPGGACYLQGDLPAGRGRHLAPGQATAYVKISDGCSRACAFCTIPSIKGPLRNRSPESVVDEVTVLVERGVKEVVLIGQDITRFGGGLAGLLGRLEAISGLEWVRLLYLYPDGLTDPLLDRLGAGGRVLPYVDMPIQHVDDLVLRAMRRATPEAMVRGTVERLRSRLPGAALRTTVITGFPGETEAAFEKLLSFVREGHFLNLGAFAFQPQEGTPAADLPGQVSTAEAEARREAVLAAQQEVSTRRLAGFVGTRQRVLVEGPSADHEWVLRGRIYAQAPEIDGTTYLELCDALPGALVDAEITQSTEYDLVATLG